MTTLDTYYYVCDSCAHVQPHPVDVDESPQRCENCANWSLSGPFVDLDFAEEISQVRVETRGELKLSEKELAQARIERERVRRGPR